MSDRIAVMDNGRVAQLGTPAQIYEDPRTAFVAKFIGESNFVEGRAHQRSGGQWLVQGPLGAFRIPGHPRVTEDSPVRIAVRPEWMDLFRPAELPEKENGLAGTIREVIYLGETMHVIVTLADGADCTVALRNEGQLLKPLPWKKGDQVMVAWLPEDCQVLEED